MLLRLIVNSLGVRCQALSLWAFPRPEEACRYPSVAGNAEVDITMNILPNAVALPEPVSLNYDSFDLNQYPETGLRTYLDAVTVGVVEEECALSVVPGQERRRFHTLRLQRSCRRLYVVDFEGAVVRRCRGRLRVHHQMDHGPAGELQPDDAVGARTNLAGYLPHSQYVLPEPQRPFLVGNVVGQMVDFLEPDVVTSRRQRYLL